MEKIIADCAAAGVHRALWDPEFGEGGAAPSGWQYDDETLEAFNQLLSGTRFPTGYGGKLRKSSASIDGACPDGLKSHNYHHLMDHMIPAMLRAHGKHPDKMPLVHTLYDFCDLFRWICSKEIDVSEIPHWTEMSKRVLSDLEKVFPPYFFTLQIHLVMHLVEDVAMCGPVHSRWMYPVERYLGQLWRDVKNPTKPEASIIQKHLNFEVIAHASDIIQAMDKKIPMGWQESHLEKLWELRDQGKKVMKKFRNRNLYNQVHDHLLHNHPAVTELLDNYRSWSAEQQRQRIHIPHNMSSFKGWLQVGIETMTERHGLDAVDPMVRLLANGPKEQYASYTKAIEGGRHFQTICADKNRKSYNSGVCCMSIVENEDQPTAFYCGPWKLVVSVYSRLQRDRVLPQVATEE